MNQKDVTFCIKCYISVSELSAETRAMSTFDKKSLKAVRAPVAS
jgi:hypothetical protein